MKHRDFLLPYFVVVALVAVLWLYSGGSPEHIFPHFDKMLHVGGGMACGVAGSWFYMMSEADHEPAARWLLMFASSAGMVIVIGVLFWEGLELLWPPMISGPFDPIDTSWDVIADFAGAFLATAYYSRQMKKCA